MRVLMTTTHDGSAESPPGRTLGQAGCGALIEHVLDSTDGPGCSTPRAIWPAGTQAGIRGRRRGIRRVRHRPPPDASGVLSVSRSGSLARVDSQPHAEPTLGAVGARTADRCHLLSADERRGRPAKCTRSTVASTSPAGSMTAASERQTSIPAGPSMTLVCPSIRATVSDRGGPDLEGGSIWCSRPSCMTPTRSPRANASS